MRERKQRHDDAHYPMGGRGRRAWRSSRHVVETAIALSKEPGRWHCLICEAEISPWTTLCAECKDEEPQP